MGKIFDALEKNVAEHKSPYGSLLSNKKIDKESLVGHGKPQASVTLYSLPEIAKTIGVDENQLHHYAHKGLIDPIFSNDSTSRFTAVDRVRLEIIKSAVKHGYNTENILNLIGRPDEVLNAADPVSTCHHFAMEKYKQIYDELSHCEPLEQLNKQCDLKLIKTYIKHLKELQN
jgi:DNA-binding transcriptional MerR regulator